MRLRRTLLTMMVVSSLGAPQSGSRRASWNLPVEPFRIIGNVYYVGAAGVSSFLITTPQGSILLDGGLPETAPLIEAGIAALGFNVANVKYLLNSHAHFDHAGGLAALKRKSGARIVASEGDSDTLNTGGGGRFPAARVDRIVKDNDTVEVGDATLTAHVTPGHTKGCTTWSMSVADGGKAYRVVFYCSTSVVDRLVNNGAYPGIVADYERSFDALRKMPCDVFLAPHAEFFHMEEKRAKMGAGANPFVDAGEMRMHVEQSERAFRSELERERGVVSTK